MASESEGRFEEFGGRTEPHAETPNIIEFDPEAAAAPGELSVQAAAEDMGTTIPAEDLLRARDELEASLGGFEVVATALREGVTTEELGIENFLGVGVGLKQTAGTYTGDVVVKVFVREKAPLSRVTSTATIPAQVNGYPTDVEEIGEILAQTYNRRYARPVPCGVSCGHVRITAGTIGCLVVLNNNRLCMLSNNHVLANENNARPGDHIIQPGRVDGGQDPRDLIGVLERFVPVQFPGPNLVDCAAAWTAFRLVKPSHVTYRMHATPAAPSLSLAVMKNGRTTQATQGMITGLAVNGVRVRYSAGVAVFNNQIIIRGIGSGSFSQGGDSGSVIVTARTRQPVGLLFAGSPTHTIANTVSEVISALGISRFIGG
jgi:hypothetical protein